MKIVVERERQEMDNDFDEMASWMGTLEPGQPDCITMS